MSDRIIRRIEREKPLAMAAVQRGEHARNPQGQAALFLAVARGHAKAVRELLRHGADPRIPVHGRLPLAEALRSGRVAVVRALLDAGVDPNSQTEDGSPALFLALAGRRLDIVEIMLARGARADAHEEVTGATALLRAAESGWCAAVKLLVEFGANLNLPDKSGKTPLAAAIRKGHPELAELLVASGASVNARTHSGWTPLIYAADGRRSALAETLLRAGADPNAATSSGITALQRAAFWGDTSLIQILS